MILTDLFDFEKNTIIDFVVKPNLDVSSIISEFINNFSHTFILDTQGDLNLKYGKYNWELNSQEEQGMHYIFIHSIDSLYKSIEMIKIYKNFILIIDSVTFVCDIFPFGIKKLSNTLWGIIYECDATIITINHYRIDGFGTKCKLTPRMGKFWSKVISYQVKFLDSTNIKNVQIIENKIEEM